MAQVKAILDQMGVQPPSKPDPKEIRVDIVPPDADGGSRAPSDGGEGSAEDEDRPWWKFW